MKFLLSGSYSPEGVRGLFKEGGTSRRQHFEQITKAAGGTVEVFYYALGDDDVFAVVDLPSEVDIASLALSISAGGGFAAKTTALVTPEQIDEAVKRDIGYRPPGS